jgi:hypothetical protein
MRALSSHANWRGDRAPIAALSICRREDAAARGMVAILAGDEHAGCCTGQRFSKRMSMEVEPCIGTGVSERVFESDA